MAQGRKSSLCVPGLAMVKRWADVNISVVARRWYRYVPLRFLIVHAVIGEGPQGTQFSSEGRSKRSPSGLHTRTVRVQRLRQRNGSDRLRRKLPAGCGAGEVLRFQVSKREKRACKSCEVRGVVLAPLPPRIIEKCPASDQIVIDTLISKYCDHAPLYRAERDTQAGHGFGTQPGDAGWLGTAGRRTAIGENLHTGILYWPPRLDELESYTTLQAPNAQPRNRADLFAYPNGTPADYTSETKRLSSEAGYECALTTIRGVNTSETDFYELRRVGVGADMSFSEFQVGMLGW
jgi:transposase